MAIEVLLKAEDTVNPTSNKPNMLWKKGMIVDIKQVPASWGNLEGPPDFWRITIEDLDLAMPEVQEWLEQNFDPFPADPENPDVLTQRKVYLDVDKLPVPVRNDIVGDGYATVAANRLQGFRDAITVVEVV